MQKILTICFILIFPFASASADTLGLYVGGGVWSHDPSGTFSSTQSGSTPTIDIKSDLNLSKKTDSYFWLAFEHPIPFLPNIRLEKSSLTNTGSIAQTVIFNGSPATGNVDLSLDTVDGILYYRLLDNWVNLDLGLDVRKLDGRFAIGSQSVSVSTTVPMLYVAAEFDLPLTGLSVGGDYKVVSYQGSSYNDARIRVAYEMGVVGIEAGLRSTKIKLSNVDNVNGDMQFKGLMVGAFLHF